MGGRVTEVAEKPHGAHYLHGKVGLEPILRVPIKNPKVMAWVPRRELLWVVTTDNEIVEVDPAMGTRTRNALPETAEKLAIGEGGRAYAVVTKDGGILHGEAGQAPSARTVAVNGTPKSLFFAGKYLVYTASTEMNTEVQIMHDHSEVAHFTLPASTAVFAGVDGKLRYVRSVRGSLLQGKLSRKTTLSDDVQATAHSLAPNGNFVLGWTEHGAVVWNIERRERQSVSLLDLQVGTVRSCGEWVAFGTKGGVVAMFDMRTMRGRRTPFVTKAHEHTVREIRFASRGRWMASMGNRLQLWSWEASEAP